MKNNYMVFVLLVSFAALSFGAAASGPAVQLTSYDVVPDNIFAGTTGRLEVTLLNSGSEAAQGTTIFYTYGLDQRSSVYVGDVGSGSEAITTIPFIVPESVSSGIVVLNLDIYYFNEGETASQHSAASIPLAVSQHQILEVNTLSIDKDAIGKGEKLTAELEIRNTGGIMKNVLISTPENSSFTLDGTTQLAVGDITFNSSETVSVKLASSSSAAEGRYSIPIIVTYNDALQNDISQTVNIGPVMVSGPSSLFRLSSGALSDAEIGSELLYNITLENKGNSVQSAMLVIEENDVFTPLGSNTVYFDDLQPGEKRSEVVSLGVDSSSASGYYQLPMTLKANGEEADYSAGIYVKATPDLLVTSETETSASGFETAIKISNIGNTAVRSLYVYAESTEALEVTGADSKFVGTLDVDDYANFQVELQTRSARGPYELPIVIQFKDNDNAEHTVRETVEIMSSEVPAAFTNVSSDNSQRGPYGRNSGGLQMPNLLYIGGAAALLGVGYFAYRRFKGGSR